MKHQEHYKIDAELFDYFGDDQLSDGEKRRNQIVIGLCKLNKKIKVLDIGSGRGWFSLAASKKKAKTYALDLSQKNLNRISQLDPEIITTYGDAYSLPFDNHDFDLIVANEVLEHLEYPSKAINEWKRFLKTKGKLLISVPYKEKIKYNLCIHCNKKTPANAHLHSFDEEKLKVLLETAGFQIKKIRYYHSKLIILLQMNRLLKYLPFFGWNLVDTFFNIIIKKPSYISIIAEKE